MKGDFIGFSFNGKHSSEFNVIRVSDGSRYTDELTPDVEDYTTDVPGRSEVYYYGTRFKERRFSVKIAFDSLTEENLRGLREWLSYDKMAPLIFDEWPYKKYVVKIGAIPDLSYVCFDERIRRAADESVDGVRVIERQDIEEPVIDEETGEPVIDEETQTAVTQAVRYIEREPIYPYIYEKDENGNYKTQRIYKGDGTIEFVAYFPFAISTGKSIEDVEENVEGATAAISECATAARLLHRTEMENAEVDVPVLGTDGMVHINIYNAGDRDADFKLTIPVTQDKTYTITDYLTGKSIEIDTSLDTLRDSKLILNTRTRLLTGESTRILYNKMISKGDFFTLAPTTGDIGDALLIEGESINPADVSIQYDYIYY